MQDGILLEKVQADQAGTYTCIAIQELDSLKNIQSREMELIVEYGPHQLDSDLIEVSGKIGETIKLNCDAKSAPSPHFTWLRNGYETFDSVSILDNTSTLQVKIDSESDFETTFTCLALNDHGRSNQTFVLKQRSQAVEDENKSIASKTAGVLMFTTLPLFITAAFL